MSSKTRKHALVAQQPALVMLSPAAVPIGDGGAVDGDEVSGSVKPGLLGGSSMAPSSATWESGFRTKTAAKQVRLFLAVVLSCARRESVVLRPEEGGRTVI